MSCKYKVLCEKCLIKDYCITYQNIPTNILLAVPGCCHYGKYSKMCYLITERECLLEDRYATGREGLGTHNDE